MSYIYSKIKLSRYPVLENQIENILLKIVRKDSLDETTNDYPVDGNIDELINKLRGQPADTVIDYDSPKFQIQFYNAAIALSQEQPLQYWNLFKMITDKRINSTDESVKEKAEKLNYYYGLNHLSNQTNLRDSHRNNLISWWQEEYSGKANDYKNARINYIDEKHEAQGSRPLLMNVLDNAYAPYNGQEIYEYFNIVLIINSEFYAMDKLLIAYTILQGKYPKDYADYCFKEFISFKFDNPDLNKYAIIIRALSTLGLLNKGLLPPDLEQDIFFEQINILENYLKSYQTYLSFDLEYLIDLIENTNIKPVEVPEEEPEVTEEEEEADSE
jgi:hypothetical protein